MKNIHSCTLIIAFFVMMSTGLVSCSSDNDTTNSENANTLSAKLITTLPGNYANPYDEVGWLYNELFDTYYTNANLGGSVSQIITKVQSIADASSSFNSIKGSHYHNVSNTRVSYFLEHPTTCVNDVISASSMSTTGKSNLTNFINSFIIFLENENDCDVIYDKVVAYESGVLLNAALTETDKRIILTTTSITRHSAFRARKKPKKNTDPDWDIFIGNIIASTEGAEFGSAEAATMSLVTGIAQND
ncbi:hypothetical protein [Flavobacterium solisilvae]|uniref:Lipoprotein n=1 Tax=Flavobacterium solisilvae TaxID=1852019 RepID=A0ABX1QQ58_9FLAO|nr:hypothetical protein [Flavobacterium solisilvae]NMH24247.1 hypothetical protein [Flavobacterium solisilvae]